MAPTTAHGQQTKKTHHPPDTPEHSHVDKAAVRGSDMDTQASEQVLEVADQSQGQAAKTIELDMVKDEEVLWTVFSAPQPYDEDTAVRERQLRALSSWLALQPPVKVVLFGNHPSFFLLSETYHRVKVDKDIDCTFAGAPIIASMVAKAQAANTAYSVLVAPDMVLSATFSDALSLSRSRTGFIMVSQGRGRSGKTQYQGVEDRHKGDVEAPALLLWDNSPKPLATTPIPILSYFSNGHFPPALLTTLASFQTRTLLDISALVSGVASEQQTKGEKVLPLALDLSARSTVEIKYLSGGARRWAQAAPTRLEAWVNENVEAEADSLTAGAIGQRIDAEVLVECAKRGTEGTQSWCWKAQPCRPPSLLTSFWLRFLQKGHRSSHPPWLCQQLSAMSRSENTIQNSDNNSDQKVVDVHVGRREEGGDMPQGATQLEELLPRVATERRTVILVAASYGYRYMLLSFACNLRRLGLPLPLVAALDEGMYLFALEQGLPTFFDAQQTSKGLARSDPQATCRFKSGCFRRVTKLKSRAVLRVLKLGYSVLWSDIDIVWFRNPLPELIRFGPGLFPAQSDQPSEKDPPNGGNGTAIVGGSINSGFYFARSEPKVIEAFEAIVEHAASTKTSEQPSFYHVLCGGGNFTIGIDKCRWPVNGLMTVFLPYKMHPNGAVYRVWKNSQSVKRCQHYGCVTLHNNWIRGRDRKVGRAKSRGVWYADEQSRVCHYGDNNLRETQRLVDRNRFVLEDSHSSIVQRESWLTLSEMSLYKGLLLVLTTLVMLLVYMRRLRLKGPWAQNRILVPSRMLKTTCVFDVFLRSSKK